MAIMWHGYKWIVNPVLIIMINYDPFELDSMEAIFEWTSSEAFSWD